MDGNIVASGGAGGVLVLGVEGTAIVSVLSGGMTATAVIGGVSEGIMVVTDPENREEHLVNATLNLVPTVGGLPPGLNTPIAEATLEITIQGSEAFYEYQSTHPDDG